MNEEMKTLQMTDTDYQSIVEMWMFERSPLEMTMLLGGKLPTESFKELTTEVGKSLARVTIMEEKIPLDPEDLYQEMLDSGYMEKVVHDVMLTLMEEIDKIQEERRKLIPC